MTLVVEYTQVAEVILSPQVVSLLHVDAITLRGTAFPCIAPMRPLRGLAFRGSLPLFLFLILATMMVVEGALRFRCRVWKTKVRKEEVVLRYINAFWGVIMTCFSCT